MISPQSTHLTYCYDPYLSEEKLVFLDAGKPGYVVNEIPSVDDPSWQWVFSFDHKYIMVHVCVKGFQTLENARSALMWVLWNANKVFHTGGITDVIAANQFIN